MAKLTTEPSAVGYGGRPGGNPGGRGPTWGIRICIFLGEAQME